VSHILDCRHKWVMVIMHQFRFCLRLSAVTQAFSSNSGGSNSNWKGKGEEGIEILRGTEARSPNLHFWLRHCDKDKHVKRAKGVTVKPVVSSSHWISHSKKCRCDVPTSDRPWGCWDRARWGRRLRMSCTTKHLVVAGHRSVWVPNHCPDLVC